MSKMNFFSIAPSASMVEASSNLTFQEVKAKADAAQAAIRAKEAELKAAEKAKIANKKAKKAAAKAEKYSAKAAKKASKQEGGFSAKPSFGFSNFIAHHEDIAKQLAPEPEMPVSMVPTSLAERLANAGIAEVSANSTTVVLESVEVNGVKTDLNEVISHKVETIPEANDSAMVHALRNHDRGNRNRNRNRNRGNNDE